MIPLIVAAPPGAGRVRSFMVGAIVRARTIRRPQPRSTTAPLQLDPQRACDAQLESPQGTRGGSGPALGGPLGTWGTGPLGRLVPERLRLPGVHHASTLGPPTGPSWGGLSAGDAKRVVSLACGSVLGFPPATDRRESPP